MDKTTFAVIRLKRFIAAAFLAATAGCASLGALECKSNWHAIGQRDGLAGASPQDEVYAQSCPGGVDVVRYRQGWRDGLSASPRGRW